MYTTPLSISRSMNRCSSSIRAISSRLIFTCCCICICIWPPMLPIRASSENDSAGVSISEDLPHDAECIMIMPLLIIMGAAPAPAPPPPPVDNDLIKQADDDCRMLPMTDDDLCRASAISMVAVDVADVVLEALHEAGREVPGLLQRVPVPVARHAPEHPAAAIAIAALHHLAEQEPLRGVHVRHGQVLDGDEEQDGVDGGDLVDQVREHGRDALHQLRVEEADAGHAAHVAARQQAAHGVVRHGALQLVLVPLHVHVVPQHHHGHQRRGHGHGDVAAVREAVEHGGEVDGLGGGEDGEEERHPGGVDPPDEEHHQGEQQRGDEHDEDDADAVRLGDDARGLGRHRHDAGDDGQQQVHLGDVELPLVLPGGVHHLHAREAAHRLRVGDGGEGAGDHGLAAHHGGGERERQGGPEERRRRGPVEGVGHEVRVAPEESGLADVGEQDGGDEAEGEAELDGADAEVAEVREEGLRAGEAEEDAAQGDPGVLAVAPEVVDDVLGVEGAEDADVVADEVVDADAADEEQPEEDDGREQ
ncbi:hypothetical protein U9M48_011309, partial [Paspalum notatum var. saurae]